MINHYLVLAWRNFLRYKSYALVNIAALSLGLICFLVAYASHIYVNSIDADIESSENTYYLYNRIKLLGSERWSGYRPGNAPATVKYLGLDFPEIKTITRSSRRDETIVQVGAEKSYQDILFVDNNFLNVFTNFQFKSQSRENPLANPASAIISSATAISLFGSDDVLGKSVLMESDYEVLITGVIYDLPSASYAGNSVLNPDWNFLVSLDIFNEIISSRSSFDLRENAPVDIWNYPPYTTHIQFNDPSTISVEQFNDRLSEFATTRMPALYGELDLRISNVNEYMGFMLSRQLFGDGRQYSVTGALLVLGLLILVVSCLNYTNMSLVQVGARVKEVGIFKVLGAGHAQIFAQFTTELGLHTTAALMLAFYGLAGVFGFVNTQLGMNLTMDIFFNWTSLAMLLSLLALIGLVAGFYPTLLVARIKPALCLQFGAAKMGNKRLIGIMSSAQFLVSGFLLISVMLMFFHNQSTRTAFVSGDEEQVVMVENSLLDAKLEFNLLRDRLLTNPAILSVTAAFDQPLSESVGVSYFVAVISKDLESSSQTYDVRRKMVSYDYFKTVGLDLLYGRVFDRQFGADEIPSPSSEEYLSFPGPGRIVVDLETANELTAGDPGSAVGIIIFEKGLRNARGEAISMPLEIIGVVSNSPFKLEAKAAATDIYYLQLPRAVKPIIRVKQAELQQGLEHLDSIWEEMGASQPMVRSFMDERFARAYSFYNNMNNTFMGLAVVAFLIACSGLIAMTSFMTQKRNGEIAIRKVLGCSNLQIFGMLFLEISKPIAIANIFSWPIAFLVMREYFNQFVEQPEGTYFIYIGSLLLSLLIAWIAIIGQVASTSRVQPALLLRYQ